MEIVAAGPGGPPLEIVLEDYRRHHTLAGELLLGALLGALSTRRARALMALRDGRPVGAIVLSRQGQQGQIHLLHTLVEDPTVMDALLGGAEDDLSQQGGVDHVAATLALLPGSPLEEAFQRRGYLVISRARMLLDLAAYEEQAMPPAEYDLVPWREQHREEAAAVMAVVHQDTGDVALYPEVGSDTGAQCLLERVLAGEWGAFDPALSFMALHGGFLVGLCLAVWHSAFRDQGFVLDLCVEAAHRHRGLGRALVVATAQAFRTAGAAALGLAVTWSNLPARHLYEGLGFHPTERFGVFRRPLRDCH